jgi:asparagine synthase (glutamine-hydrolysing)
MMMAHGIEGRFPFLDPRVIDFSCRVPPEYRLNSLDEKHVLKLAAKKLIPEEIVRRKKQPFRAPDAMSFISGPRPDYLEVVLSEGALRKARVFDVSRVSALVGKLLRAVEDGQARRFSNSDNMAFVGILSTQLLHESLILRSPKVDADVHGMRAGTQQVVQSKS